MCVCKNGMKMATHSGSGHWPVALQDLQVVLDGLHEVHVFAQGGAHGGQDASEDELASLHGALGLIWSAVVVHVDHVSQVQGLRHNGHRKIIDFSLEIFTKKKTTPNLIRTNSSEI